MAGVSMWRLELAQFGGLLRAAVPDAGAIGELVEVLVPQRCSAGGVVSGTIAEAPPAGLQVDVEGDEQGGFLLDSHASGAPGLGGR